MFFQVEHMDNLTAWYNKSRFYSPFQYTIKEEKEINAYLYKTICN